MSHARPLAWLTTLDRTWPTTTRTTPASQSLRLAGVAVGADLSCALGAGLTAWTFASGFLPETNPGATTLAYWTAGALGALLVLGSLLAHELGHAIAARRAGHGVARITLSFVGGTSEIVGSIRQARDEIVIAAAGPLASLAAALVAAIVHVVLVETIGPGLPATVVALVAVANLALAALNALPGLPLDGGRVLRALVWRITGHYDGATRLAAMAGRRLGELLIAVAIFASAFGFVALALWAALLGFVLRES